MKSSTRNLIEVGHDQFGISPNNLAEQLEELFLRPPSWRINEFRINEWRIDEWQIDDQIDDQIDELRFC